MRTGRHTLATLLAVGVMATTLVAVLSSPSAAAPGESDIPIANPDLEVSCGLNVLVFLDESTSIAISNATEDMRDAFRAFIDSLNNTGSAVSVVEFSTQARLPQIGSSPPGTYVTIDDTTVGDFEDYIANGYNPDGYTNWEDALRVGRYFAPRPTQAVPHLVVFLTDGDPTAVIRNDRVTYDPGNPSVAQNEYENKVPLDDDEVQSNVNVNQGVTPAISNANALKAAGSHILAIGVGEALQNPESQQRLTQIAGQDVFTGAGDLDITTDDVYLEPNFADLEEALRVTAFELCAPSVSIRKLIDDTPDPDTFDDALPGAGFEGEGTVTNIAADDFTWVLPVTADQGSTSATAVTDGAGFATFQWTPDDPAVSSDFQIVETTPVDGYQPAQAACTFRTPDIPDTDFPFEVITDGAGDPIGIGLADIPPDSIVTCQIINTAIPDPSITIEKYTNFVDADNPPGPFIPLGGDVQWTYVVTNNGNLILSDVVVTDDQGVTVTCPTDTLAPGERMTCTASGIADEAGQYENIATVDATDSYGMPLTDEDPSHYFGDDADIDIEKHTVVPGIYPSPGEDADQYIDENGNVIAPLVPVGADVTWEFEVTNPSEVTVENILVEDRVGGVIVATTEDGTITCPSTELASEDSMTCTTRTETAVAGAYENFGRVTATDPNQPGVDLVDNDPSHYLSYELGVDIEKATNGNDADIPPPAPGVPVLTAGDEVLWTYVVTNTGNAPLTFPAADGEWTVVDSEGVTVTCPDAPDTLLAGSSFTCEASDTAVDTGAGFYANTGSVTAIAAIPPTVTLPDGHPLLTDTVTDEDPSHYIGQTPAIDIEKATNTEDADDPTGPYVPIGDTVQWTYVITNTGTATLHDVGAADFRTDAGPNVLTCEETVLQAGQSMGCDPVDGTSEPGQFTNLAGVSGLDEFGNRVSELDPSHYFGVESGIELEKYTNGVDADEPTGPHIEVGEEVVWTYIVHNSSNVDIEAIEVSDDVLGPIECPATTLEGGGFMTCTSEPGTAERGQYENIGTVTAQTVETQQPLTDDDPSHYIGFVVDIDIEKATNGEDADEPTGPTVPIGDTVTWTYVVTNPGDIPIRDVVVTDDQGVTPEFQGGDSNEDGLLDVDETWTYTASAPAELGQYENVSTVVGFGNFELGHEVSDSDPSHYIGVEEAIQIVKTPNEAEVPRGDPHTFQIEVTNIGTSDLTDVVVTDPVTPSCENTIGDLAVDEVVTYECDVDAVFEPIDNTAFVEGTGPTAVVTDEDDASVTPLDTGGSALIGDTVWFDDNENGVQDGDEAGIAGAMVRIVTISETVEAQSDTSSGEIPLAIDETFTTDADGHYLAPELVAGTYEVTLDLSSVDGDLTTPGSVIIPLNVGDQRLDADFGVAQEDVDPDDDLPFTGADFARFGGVALALIAMGFGILLVVRHGPRVFARLRP